MVRIWINFNSEVYDNKFIFGLFYFKTVHPGQQMMPQQGPLPPPRGMNMANGSHGNPMNPNMMQGKNQIILKQTFCFT